MVSLLDSLAKLLKDVELYSELLWPYEGPMRIGLELTDTGENATLILDEGPRVERGLVKPIVKITMEDSTLEKIMKREADAFALGGRSRMDEIRPINFEFLEAERIKEGMEAIKSVATYFFNPGKIKIKQLCLELAGKAHGAHPLPLVYWEGLRSAWYFIDAGEVLNKEGEKDPWPQLFIVIEGSGRAIIGDDEISLQPKTAVYVPRNVFHQVIAEEPVELLWIAWDAE